MSDLTEFLLARPATGRRNTMSETPIDVTECPDCGECGRYDGRVLIRGRGVYTCPDGHRWQDLDEVPSTKGYAVMRDDDR